MIDSIIFLVLTGCAVTGAMGAKGDAVMGCAVTGGEVTGVAETG